MAFTATGIGKVPRTAKHLKKIWDRIKAKAKDDYDRLKPKIKTGVAPPPIPYPEGTAKVLDLICGGGIDDTGYIFDCDSTSAPPDDDILGTGNPTPIISVSDRNVEVVYEEELHPVPSPDWTEPLQENGNIPANSASVSKHSTFDPTPLKERKQGRSLKFSPLDSFSKDKDFYTEALDIERKILKETF